MLFSDELRVALIKERQAEIRREFDRYHLARALRAGRPAAPQRLPALIQCVWRQVIGAERALLQRSAHVDSEEERWPG